jgi:hypothetical protein
MANTNVGEKDDSGEGKRGHVEANEHIESPPAEEQPLLTVADARTSSSKETRVPAQSETPIPAREKPVQETLPSRTQEVEVKDPSEAIRIECDSPCTLPRDTHHISPEANPRKHTTALTEPTSPHNSPPHTQPETISIESGTPGRIERQTPTTDTDTETENQETRPDTPKNTELLDVTHTLTPISPHPNPYQPPTHPTPPSPTPPKNPIHLQSEDIHLTLQKSSINPNKIYSHI